jgi:hypothetical protein
MENKSRRGIQDREQMLHHLQDWQKQGGNLIDYCRKHNLDYQRVKSWKARLGFPKLRERKKKSSKPSGFIALEAPAVATSPLSPSFAVEVLLSDGTRLRFGRLPAHTFKSIAVGQC